MATKKKAAAASPVLRSVMVREDSPSPGIIPFVYREPEDQTKRTTVIKEDDWEALGSPDEITVTVEPGNTLS